MVYAHGGGAVSGTAEMYKPLTACLAVETNTVVISVDYRLAPETKCPQNIMDFYLALKVRTALWLGTKCFFFSVREGKLFQLEAGP